MTDFLKKYKWKIAGTIVGAIAGYAYYYYIGCNSGTCPIQSHWQTSTLYGALIGYVFVNSPNKKTSKEKQDSEKIDGQA
jgi:phosphate/sulfate permease